MPTIQCRPITITDVPLLFAMIKELAAYENMSDDVIGSKEDLQASLFVRKAANAILAYDDQNQPVGYCIWFYNFSTFTCKQCLYIEDIFIRSAHRRKGYGEQVLRHMASIAVEQQCSRMEWAVLDWNQSAIDFYQKLGASPMDTWTTFRLTGDALTKLGSTNMIS